MRLWAFKASSLTPGAARSELLEWCTKAEARVAELQKQNDLIKEIKDAQSHVLDAQDRAVQEKEGATATSASLEPLSFPTLSGMVSGLITQPSPQLGED